MPPEMCDKTLTKIEIPRAYRVAFILWLFEGLAPDRPFSSGLPSFHPVSTSSSPHFFVFVSGFLTINTPKSTSLHFWLRELLRPFDKRAEISTTTLAAGGHERHRVS